MSSAPKSCLVIVMVGISMMFHNQQSKHIHRSTHALDNTFALNCTKYSEKLNFFSERKPAIFCAFCVDEDENVSSEFEISIHVWHLYFVLTFYSFSFNCIFHLYFVVFARE